MGLTCARSCSGSLLMLWPTESVLVAFSSELISSLHPLVLHRGQRQLAIPHQQSADFTEVS